MFINIIQSQRVDSVQRFEASLLIPPFGGNSIKLGDFFWVIVLGAHAAKAAIPPPSRQAKSDA